MAEAKKQMQNHAAGTQGNAREEIVGLVTRQDELRVLVGELLLANEELRQKVARLEEQGAESYSGYWGLPLV